jgi:hypothetical protein
LGTGKLALQARAMEEGRYRIGSRQLASSFEAVPFLVQQQASIDCDSFQFNHFNESEININSSFFDTHILRRVSVSIFKTSKYEVSSRTNATPPISQSRDV